MHEYGVGTILSEREMQMDRLNGMLPKIAAGLATAGIIGLVVLYGTQMGLARDVGTNGKKATECCTKAHENEKDIAIIGAKFDAFQTQYEKDQREAARQRKAILDAVNKK